MDRFKFPHLRKKEPSSPTLGGNPFGKNAENGIMWQQMQERIRDKLIKWLQIECRSEKFGKFTVPEKNIFQTGKHLSRENLLNFPSLSFDPKFQEIWEFGGRLFFRIGVNIQNITRTKILRIGLYGCAWRDNATNMFLIYDNFSFLAEDHPQIPAEVFDI